MNNKLTVYKDNRVIEAGYRLSKLEQCLILYSVGKNNPKNFQRKISFQVKDFVEMFPTFSEKHIYTQLKDAVAHLYERSVVVEDPIKKSMFRWVSSADYYKNEARIDVNFTEEIEPYLTDLSERFTHYKLVNVSKFTNQYSFRLYELLTQYRTIGKRDISVGDFRKYLLLENKYKETRKLTDKVIKPCINEINKYSDLIISYSTIKKGVKVEGFKFTIKVNNQINIEEQIEQSTKDEINQIIKNKVKANIEKENADNADNLNLYASIIKALEENEQGLIKLNAKEINLLIKFEKSFHKNNRQFIFKSKEQEKYLLGVLSKKGTLKNHIENNKNKEVEQKKQKAISKIKLENNLILTGVKTGNKYVVDESLSINASNFKNATQDGLSISWNLEQDIKELIVGGFLKI